MDSKNITTHLTINQLSPADKPREKLLANGKKSLSDAELIAILLGSGTQGNNAVELAQKSSLILTILFSLSPSAKPLIS